MNAIFIRRHSRWTAFLHDIACIPIAWFGAYWLRFNLDPMPLEVMDAALLSLPLMMVCQALSFWYFGLYRGVWRFASLPDLTRIIKSIIVGTLVSMLTVFLVMRMQHVPRSVIPIYAMALLLMLGGSRFAYRWAKDKKALFGASFQRVLIVGAGNAGDSLARDLLKDMSQGYLPVAFVDDRKQKIGREIHGLRVYGPIKDIPNIVKRYLVDVIIIAIPSANAAQMRQINAICQATEKPVRTLPGVNDLVSGKVMVQNLRNISLEDLLGRDPVQLDWNAIRFSLKDKTIFVTGGGGSIGSELCRQILSQNPEKLVVIDSCEYYLFQLEQEFAKLNVETNISYHLVDICDVSMVWRLFRHYEPQVVYHAAAYKHVPLLEPQVRAAMRNNVLGTYYIAQAAAMTQAEKFVLVSTDKAVNPSNIMGATKRGAELVCQHFNIESKTKFITVRFGNVLGSRGSVVETFKTQLANGGPLTVTHRDVTRFFMTIQEACQLILQAMTLGQGGEVFVLDMGEPVKIRYMAEQMIRLAGKEDEIDIEYVGLRPGEKLYEELFHKKEQLQVTMHTKIFKAQARAIDSAHFAKMIKAIEEAALSCQEETLNHLLYQIVPEYQSMLNNQCTEHPLVHPDKPFKEVESL